MTMRLGQGKVTKGKEDVLQENVAYGNKHAVDTRFSVLHDLTHSCNHCMFRAIRFAFLCSNQNYKSPENGRNSTAGRRTFC